jgi:hypothetical protein
MFKPKIIIIREDLFAIAGRDYLEALLLHRFLQNDFIKLYHYTFEQLHEDMMLTEVKSSKINKAVTRLVDKGYLQKCYSGASRSQINSYKCLRDAINRDLLRLGYPEYVEFHD